MAPTNIQLRLFFAVSAIVLLLFIQTNAIAQPGLQPRFIPLNGSRNYDDIKTVLPDSKGFLWFGCNQGLIRFDGNAYRRFEPGNSNKTIATDQVTALHEDMQGNIWIGAAGKGLYSYNYTADSFTLHIITANKAVEITAIEQYNNDILITATKAVYIFNAQNNKTREIKFTDSLLKNNFTVIKTVQDPANKNILWMLTSAGIHSYNDNTGFLKKWHDFGFSTDEVGNLLTTLTVTANGKVFSATKNKGLVELDIKSAKSTLHSFSKNSTTAYTSNNIDALYAYDDRFLFTATQDSGVAVFDITKNTFTFLNQHHFPESGFIRFQAKAFGASRHNMVMAAQHDGIWVFNKASQLFSVSAVLSAHNKVPGTLYTRSIYAASEKNKVYAGSYFGDGLYVFDNNTGSTKTYPFLQNKNNGQTLIINAIFEDHAGITWLASHENRLLIFDEAKQQVIPAAVIYPALANFSGKKIYCFHEDKQHNLYVATGDAGLLKLDEKRQIKTVYQHNDNDSSSILTNNLFAEKIFEDNTGRLWLSARSGITVLDPASQKFYHFTNLAGKYNSVPGSFWYSIVQDNSGFIYIGTGEGMYRIQANAGTINDAEHFTEKDGLQHNSIFSFVKDKQGLLWITCRNGLSCFDPVANTFRNFNYRNGLPSKTLMAPMQLSDDGTVYHGAVEKYFSFKPQQLLSQNVEHAVWFTAFKIFDKDSITGFSINSLQQILLNHNQNSFSFGFISPSLFYPDAVTYSYMLEGFDADWKTGSNRPYAAYTNVKPGKYILKIKAAGADGLWSKNTRQIEIVIAAPFWQTLWFRILALLFAALVGYTFIKRREKQAANREAEKTEMEKLKAMSYQYQLEIEQVTNYFASSIYEQETIDAMLWDVAKNCISKLDFEDCVIYLFDEKRKVLVQKAAWGPKTTDENKIMNPIEIPAGKGIVGDVAATGKAEIINDTSADTRYIVDDASRFSEITVPIVKDKNVIGVIDSESSRKNFYTERHLQILSTIASLLADKIGKMKAEQQTREKEIEVLKLNKDLATWQITALRAQMNPHFIFNAMNSIQQFTLQNDVDNANLYISKFSRLLRKVLYSSQQDMVTLEEETEQLSLYMDIEKLRMGNSFVYEIKMDEDIETDALKIPGMLVQPFVENAIKHGLALKEGEKKLVVEFTMPDEQHLHAVITDNGIGRKKAAEMKEQQTLLPHISKGIQLVKERLQILQQNSGHNSSIQIEDLPADSGTRVTVTIPLP